MADEIMFSFVRGPVHSYVTKLIVNRIFMKMNKPILTLIGTRGRRGKIMKCSTLGVRRSKVKIT